MTRAGDDRDLREAFRALREEEGRSFPPWRAPVPAPLRPPRLAPLLAGSAVLLAAALFWSRPMAPGGPDLAQWRSSTDFLLQTPAREVLTVSPVLGRGFDFQ